MLFQPIKLQIFWIITIIDHNLDNFLFGAVKLIKNTDIDKYKYSGYGIVHPAWDVVGTSHVGLI